MDRQPSNTGDAGECSPPPSEIDGASSASAAAKENLKFRLGIERSSDAIFMTAADGTFTYVNPAFEALYGFTSAETIGKTPRLLKSGKQSVEFYPQFWAKLSAKQVVVGDLVNQSKDGKLIVVETTATPILDERGEILGFLAIQRDITERLRATRELKLFRMLIDQSNDAIEVIDPNTGRFIDVNEKGCHDLGYTRDEYLSLTVPDVDPSVDASMFARILGGIPLGQTRTWDGVHRRKDGSTFPVEVSLRHVQLDRNYLVTVARDVTERKRAEEERAKLEEQLRQSQKMEAIGNLAGGVAHDFNNLLSVILSYASLLAADLKTSDPIRADILEIEAAAKRGADLTRQLLAFGRRQLVQPRPLDLNDLVQGLQNMLRRLVGEGIELNVLHTPGLGMVVVDEGQVEQIVVNLVVNARDAMPQGGKLTIEAVNAELDAEYAAAHVGVTPGPHVVLLVSDTGTGMDKATQARMFEPFFTTKERGQGTGLGLATVFGMVKQNHGHIWVYSEPGAGTTIKVYFPRSNLVPVRNTVSSSPPLATLRGTETILLVEDEEPVRVLVRSILRRCGYHVLDASSGGDGLLLCEQHGGTIHLMLTDVVMPRMSGRQLADRLKTIRPGMKVLYMSGYTDNSIVHHGVLDSGVAFLQKPITPDALSRKVREVLDTTAPT